MRRRYRYVLGNCFGIAARPARPDQRLSAEAREYQKSRSGLHKMRPALFPVLFHVTAERGLFKKEVAMTTTMVASLESLGLCEHCGTLLSVEDMSGDSMNAEWHCLNCKGLLSGLSFGYEGEGEKTKKVKWVGPERKWVATRPTEDFVLGNLSVEAVYLPMCSINSY